MLTPDVIIRSGGVSLYRLYNLRVDLVLKCSMMTAFQEPERFDDSNSERIWL